MPTLSLALLLNLGTYLTYAVPDSLKRVLYLILFINTFAMPAFSAFFLYKRKIISSIEMSNRGERWFPLLITAFFYFFSYFLLKRIQLSDMIFAMVFGAALSVTLAFLINFFFKISAHMIGIGGLAGVIAGLSITLGADLRFMLVPVIMAAGLLGYARLALNAHKPAEVYSGFALGFLCELLAVANSWG